MRKPKLGSGARFRALTGKLEAKGVRDPRALAAYIGRKKYGTQKFQGLSAKGRKRAAIRSNSSVSSGRKYL